jgi:hypothetical protein
MKHGKKLKRWMKVLLKKKGLNPENWYYIKNLPGELVIVHRYSLKTRAIKLEEEGVHGH